MKRFYALIGFLSFLSLLSATAAGQTLPFTAVGHPFFADSDGYGQSPAWGDYDNDGDEDLLVANGANIAEGQVPFLYRNEGFGDFTRIMNTPLTTDTAAYYGAAWGDYDNDGDLDIFLAGGVDGNGFNHANRLYRNEDSRFIPMQSAAPVIGFNSWARGCSWVDYDLDGTLDLFIPTINNEPDHLYQNEGSGVFTRVTSGAFVTEPRNSYCVAWGDYDNDRDPDLAMGMSNGVRLFENLGNNAWRDTTLFIGEAYHSLAWGDYDNDGWLDLFAANIDVDGGAPDHNLLFHNDGGRALQRVTTGPVATDPVTGCVGSVWADFDQDGDLDLFASNYTSAGNFLYVNHGNGGFHRDTLSLLYRECTAVPAAADYDNDGDIDIFSANLPVGCSGIADQLYRNENPYQNNLLKVKLVGVRSNRAAIGAQIRVKAQIDGRPVWQLREISEQTGIGHNSLIAHFGLGNAARADSVIIRWPHHNSPDVVLTLVDNNQMITVIEKLATGTAEPVHPATSFHLQQNYPNPFNPATRIAFTLRSGGSIELAVFDILGAKVAMLASGHHAAGTHQVDFDGALLPGGFYFYRLKTADGRQQTRKMLLVK